MNNLRDIIDGDTILSIIITITFCVILVVFIYNLINQITALQPIPTHTTEFIQVDGLNCVLVDGDALSCDWATWNENQ